MTGCYGSKRRRRLILFSEVKTLPTIAWATAVTALVVYCVFLLDAESPWVGPDALELTALLCLPAVLWNRQRTRAPLRLALFLVLAPVLLAVFGGSVYYVHEKLGFQEFPGILLAVVPPAVAGMGLFWLLRLVPVTKFMRAEGEAGPRAEFMEMRTNKEVEAVVARYVGEPSARITCVHLRPVESALRAAGLHLAPVSLVVYQGIRANRFEVELKPRTVTARETLNLAKLHATFPLAPSVHFQLPMDDDHYERIQKPDPALNCTACDSSKRFAEQCDIRFPA